MKKSELKNAIKEVFKEIQLRPTPSSIKPKPEKQISPLGMLAANINQGSFNGFSETAVKLMEQGVKSGYFDEQQEVFELLIELLKEDFKTGNPGDGEVFKLDL